MAHRELTDAVVHSDGVVIPDTLIHYTTAEGAAGIADTGEILRGPGRFGNGVYTTTTEAEINPFLPAGSTIPIPVSGDGFTRIIPSLVFLNGDSNALTAALYGLYGTAENILASANGNSCLCGNH